LTRGRSRWRNVGREESQAAGRSVHVRDRWIKAALQDAMNLKGPALVNVMISQESAHKPQQFRWHS
jgi:hypothetical protein